MWGGFELILDPYTQANKGLINIIGSMFVDVAIRRPTGFAISKDVTVS
jgi:hypothetical protein